MLYILIHNQMDIVLGFFCFCPNGDINRLIAVKYIAVSGKLLYDDTSSYLIGYVSFSYHYLDLLFLGLHLLL